MDYLSRAMAAYFRSCSKNGYPVQPSKSSGEQEHNGKRYVVLRSGNEILKVYRITTSGQLKNLRRWPKELENY